MTDDGLYFIKVDSEARKLFNDDEILDSYIDRINREFRNLEQSMAGRNLKFQPLSILLVGVESSQRIVSVCVD